MKVLSEDQHGPMVARRVLIAVSALGLGEAPDLPRRASAVRGMARWARKQRCRDEMADHAYLIMPWAAKLACDPRILDVVEDLLGSDLLIYTSTFFIQEPHSPTIAAWHRDSTYYGLEPKEEATVWIALTEANQVAGCMEALSIRGKPRQLRHASRVVEHSVNRASQMIIEPLDDDSPVAMPLAAGSFSMHHGLCPHRSSPNSADHRRIGLGLNYIPTHVRPAGSVSQRRCLSEVSTVLAISSPSSRRRASWIRKAWPSTNAQSLFIGTATSRKRLATLSFPLYVKHSARRGLELLRGPRLRPDGAHASLQPTDTLRIFVDMLLAGPEDWMSRRHYCARNQGRPPSPRRSTSSASSTSWSTTPHSSSTRAISPMKTGGAA
jgi:phytanoyl-CoA dioxygenase PhyH